MFEKSRPTAYKYIERYKEYGMQMFIDDGIFRFYYRDFLLTYVDWNEQKAYDNNDRIY